MGIMDMKSKSTHEVEEPMGILPSSLPQCLSDLLQLCYALLFRLGLLELS